MAVASGRKAAAKRNEVEPKDKRVMGRILKAGYNGRT
jgi:hypothetical protein